MIANALLSLCPNCKWVINGDNYADIDWQDDPLLKPTETEVNAEIARLQADYDVKEYQRDRANEYPSIVDQLDTLYHGGYDAWKASIDVVKNKYPKGAA